MFNRSNNDYVNNQPLNSSADIDEGLRNYMNGIYNRMAMGLAVAGGVAFVVSSNEALMTMLLGSGLIYVAFIAILGLGFFSGSIIMNRSMGAANAMFWATAALWGLALSPYALMYTGADLTTAFLSTAIAFAGVSLVGYTTEKDLGPMGRALGMAVFGILAILILNIFVDFGGGFMNVVMPIVVIAVFAGLTAYETQNLKNVYFQTHGETRDRVAILGALSLFGNFVTMFIWMLQLMGGNRE